MKTIMIADDENHVCLELKYIIEKEKNVELVNVCSTGAEALEQIGRSPPDIAFLDVKMPGVNGIQIGYSLKSLHHQIYVIYVSAYSQYAVDAFKVGAKGYILKPFSEEDVREHIRHAVEYLDSNTKRNDKEKIIPKTKLPVESNGKFKLIDQSDIIFSYANNRAVYIRAKGHDFLVNFSLSELEVFLNNEQFIRCHRNYIVNVTKVTEVIPWFNSTYMLVMEDASQVAVSRAHVKLMKEVFCL